MAQEKLVTQSTDEKTTQTDPNQPQVLGGSSQGSVTSPTARVASFSSGQQNTPGSGRFTNIQKYLNANQSATDSLGAKANKTFDTQFNTGQKDVDTKNQALSAAFNKGRETLQTGQGFQTNLQDIGKGFETGFTDFGNRQGFDAAGQQAIGLAQNQNFGNIASGQAIDETGLTAQQAQALQGAQGLVNTTKTNLGNVETEQGRSDLFSKVLQPKQGYTSGQRSFDQLFLGGALGGIKSNLQGQQNVANQLAQSTAEQQKSLEEIISGESALTSGLTGQATANQDVFDRVFGDQKNIDFINDLRNKRYENVKNQLQTSGAVSQEDADLLGIGNLTNTYANQNQYVDSKFAEVGTQVQPNTVGTYNVLKGDLDNYITRGQDAQNVQDITSQQDYNSYKALQQLALGRNTGKIDGVSQLGSSINSTGKLATDITASDEAFKKGLTDNTLSGNFSFGGNGYLDSNVKGQTALNLLKDFRDRGYTEDQIQSMPLFSSNLRGFAGPNNDLLRQINYDGRQFQGSSMLEDVNTNAGNNLAYSRTNALRNAINNLNQTGYKDTLDITNETPQYSRFKGLV